ncbi:MAG: DUF167 domain-containing protein [Spirochaetaceae bacterium]|jgi:uncharacterized protein (TIGR00251 family)|nr:DUF167 domain-containing protein [Spirochaetaceae bacterium]
MENGKASLAPQELSPALRIEGERALLDLKVQPGASVTGLAGLKGDRLRVRIAAAPEDGKANAELLRFFAGLLGCARRDITLLSGEKSRLKTISFPAGLLAKDP